MKCFDFCRTGECRVWFNEPQLSLSSTEIFEERVLTAKPGVPIKNVRIAAEMRMKIGGNGLLEAEFHPDENGEQLHVQMGLRRENEGKHFGFSPELCDGIQRGIAVAAENGVELGAGLLRFDGTGSGEMESPLLIFESLARFVVSLLPMSEAEAEEKALDAMMHSALSAYFIHPCRKETPKAPKLLDYRQRVRVTGGDWLRMPTGIVSSRPRLQKMRIGWEYRYYVEFDFPAQDILGEGPYIAATVMSHDLERLD